MIQEEGDGDGGSENKPLPETSQHRCEIHEVPIQGSTPVPSKQHEENTVPMQESSPAVPLGELVPGDEDGGSENKPLPEKKNETSQHRCEIHEVPIQESTPVPSKQHEENTVPMQESSPAVPLGELVPGDEDGGSENKPLPEKKNETSQHRCEIHEVPIQESTPVPSKQHEENTVPMQESSPVPLGELVTGL